MSDLFPVELQRTENRELFIRWSDGSEQTIPFRNLRDSCQCATCMEKKTSQTEKPAGMLNILSPAEARPLQIETMKPVGNYAYNISFSDGHSTGIFSFELLRSITG